MAALDRGSLEARVMRELAGRVVERGELARKLRVKESVLATSLKRLQSMGLIEYDVLPDKVWVRPTGKAAGTVGVKPTQKRRLVRKRQGKKAVDYVGPAYR
jgi:hypothetical protein